MNELLQKLLARLPAIASEVDTGCTETIAALNDIKEAAVAAEAWTQEHENAVANIASAQPEPK